MMSKKKKKTKKLFSPRSWLHNQNTSMKKNQGMEDMMSQKYSGRLSKYTNLVTGWQYRWFILDPKNGVLSYYLSESEHDEAPRNSMHLAGALICPSEEDSHTFSVNATSGESFKLRAADARSRQEWINKLRSVAEYHNNNFIKCIPSKESHDVTTYSGVFVHGDHIHSPATCESFSSAKQHLQNVQTKFLKVNKAIECLSVQGEAVSSTDSDLLILKACSQSVVTCLQECVNILQHSFAADCGFRNAPTSAVLSYKASKPLRSTKRVVVHSKRG